MKKYLFASLAAIAVLAGCSKEMNTPEPQDKGLTFTVSTEEVKTVLEEGDKVSWQETDQITVCGIYYKVAEIKEDASCAVFEKVNPSDPDPVPSDGKYRAYYPAGIDTEMKLPQVQSYVAPNSLAAVSPMYAESETTDLVFTNICGLLELVVKGQGTVSRIDVKDAEKSLYGPFTVNEGAAQVDYDTEEEEKEHLDGISLNCGDGVYLSTDNAAAFRIALPVGEYSQLSFIFYSDAQVPCEFCLKPETSVTISKNTIYPVNVNVEFSASGSNTGTFTVGEGRRVTFSTGNLTVDEGIPFIEDYFMNNEYVYGRFTHQMGWQDFSEKYKEIIGEEWRMLSSTEWQYLLEKRQMVSSSAPRYLNATDGPVVISGVKYYGLLIFPDDYDGNAETETYTWAKMQKLGIAFLPATGCDYLSAEDGRAKYGRYWAADEINGQFACSMAFGPAGVNSYNAFGKSAGYNVRLVMDVE